MGHGRLTCRTFADFAGTSWWAVELWGASALDLHISQIFTMIWEWSENDLRMICSCYFMIYNIYQYFTVLVKLMLLHPIIFAMIHPFTLLLHHRFLKNFALNGVCCGPNGLLTAWSQDHPRPSKTDKTKICWVIATAFVIPGWEWSEKLVRMA